MVAFHRANSDLYYSIVREVFTWPEYKLSLRERYARRGLQLSDNQEEDNFSLETDALMRPTPGVSRGVLRRSHHVIV